MPCSSVKVCGGVSSVEAAPRSACCGLSLFFVSQGGRLGGACIETCWCCLAVGCEDTSSASWGNVQQSRRNLSRGERTSSLPAFRAMNASRSIQVHTQRRLIMYVGQPLTGRGRKGNISVWLLAPPPASRCTIRGMYESAVALRFLLVNR
jgi:hypothetical protein